MTSGRFVTSLTEEKAASYNPRPQSESTFITSNQTLFLYLACPPGQERWFPFEPCEDCDTGTYRDGSEANSLCKSCPEGSTTTIQGATDVSDCSGRKLFPFTVI